MPGYIITGGPGSGKSTLIDALRSEGFSVFDEVSRQAIKEEVASKSSCLPWIDLASFAEKVLKRMESDCSKASAFAGNVFFDRGIPDILAYLKVHNLEIPEYYYAAVKRANYNSTVFIAPPWREIYINDAERWQTYKESVALFHAISHIYLSLGFVLVEIPKTSLEARVKFIISEVTSKGI